MWLFDYLSIHLFSISGKLGQREVNNSEWKITQNFLHFWSCSNKVVNRNHLIWAVVDCYKLACAESIFTFTNMLRKELLHVARVNAKWSLNRWDRLSANKTSWHWIICLTLCHALCHTSSWHHLLLLPTSPHGSGALHVLTVLVGLCVWNRPPVCLPISMFFPMLFRLLATLSLCTHTKKSGFCFLPCIFFQGKYLLKK